MVGIGQRGMAMLFKLDWAWPAMLYCITQAMERTNTRVTAPGEDQFAHTAHPNQLIVDQVWCHADQGQITATLTNDFVAGSKGDEVGKPLHRYGHPILDRGGYCLSEREKPGHQTTSLAR